MNKHDIEISRDTDGNDIITLIDKDGSAIARLFTHQSDIVKLVPAKKCICCAGPEWAHNN